MNDTQNTISSVSNAIQANSLFAYIVLLIVLVLVVGFFVVVSKKGFMLDKSKGKLAIGNIGDDPDKEKSVNENASNNINQPQPSNATAINEDKFFDDKKFLKLISRIIDRSIDLGYTKSTKRHNVYTSQMKVVYDSFERIKSEICLEYSNNVNNSNTLIINTMLSSLISKSFNEKFEVLFREDKLISNTQEALIEKNRPLIESFTTILISELQNNYSNYNFFDLCQLKNAINDKKDFIKKELLGCLTRAYEMDNDYNKDLKQIEADLTNTINNIIITFDPCFNEILKNNDSWDDSYPPNDIV